MGTNTQRALSGGELSPSLHSRVDFNKFYTSARKIKNWVVKKQGGIENRPGTEFVAEIHDSTKNARLIPFDAGSDAQYVLEFGEQTMRVIKDGSLVTSSSASLTGVTAANPAVVTYAGADIYTAGDRILLAGFAGSLGQYLNGRILRVGTVTAGSNIFNLLNLDGTNFNSTTLPAYTSGGTATIIYKISTQYDDADLDIVKYEQSVDTMTLAHADYEVKELVRTSDASWAFDPSGVSVFGTNKMSSAPTGLVAAQQGTTGAVTYSYTVTVVDFDGVEYEPASGGIFVSTVSVVNGNATLSATDYIKITITNSGSAAYYRIYRRSVAGSGGAYGYIGSTNTLIFSDIGYTPDFSINPPEYTYDLYNNSTDDYPGAVAIVGQRRYFANTNNDKEGIWGSFLGNYYGFHKIYHPSDANALNFKASSKKYNPVKHILDMSKMVVMTENSEIVVNPDGSPITPSNTAVKGNSYNGCTDLRPIMMNDTALYVEKGGQIIRDLLFDFNIDALTGNDLTLLATHLFEGKEIVDWCYQKKPDSVVWIVRDDGKVLSLTYLREQQILAFAQHEFSGGFVEGCASVSNDSADDVYFIIKRTINSKTVRYIERLSSRVVLEDKIKDVVVGGVASKRTYNSVIESKILDCNASYDGRGDGAVTVTITEGSGWTVDDTVNVAISDASFVSTDVGNAVHVYSEDGIVHKLRITAYVDASNVTCQPLNQDIPSELQNIATTDYGIAKDTIKGLWHLEGEDVSILADGYVKADPNDENYTVYTVTNGAITLDDTYVLIHIGLPIVAEFQTLNIDSNDGVSLLDKKINIQKVTLYLDKTRGLLVGKDEDSDLVELKLRDTEGYNSPIDLKSGPADVIIESEWNSTGSVYVKQTNPLPANICAIGVSGYIPGRN